MWGVSSVCKTFVRSGIRTHAWRTRLRPERSALDRSAILTWYDVNEAWIWHECDTWMHAWMVGACAVSAVKRLWLSANTWHVRVASKPPLRAGFEPAREDPIGFQVQRLNHSAITAYIFSTQSIKNRLRKCWTDSLSEAVFIALAARENNAVAESEDTSEKKNFSDISV